MHHRLTRLEVIAGSLATASSVVRRREAGYLALELHGCWSEFNRVFFLSALCGVRDLGGGLVIPNAGVLPNPEEALAQVKGFLGRKPYQHVPWFSPFPERLAAHFDLSNATSIRKAVAYPSTLETLTTIRNFFAHKSMSTSQKVLNLAMNKALLAEPEELLLDVVAVGKPPLIKEWLADARQRADLMMS